MKSKQKLLKRLLTAVFATALMLSLGAAILAAQPPKTLSAASGAVTIDLGEAWFENEDNTAYAANWSYGHDDNVIYIKNNVNIIGAATGSKTLYLDFGNSGATATWTAELTGTTNSTLLSVYGDGSLVITGGAKIEKSTAAGTVVYLVGRVNLTVSGNAAVLSNNGYAIYAENPVGHYNPYYQRTVTVEGNATVKTTGTGSSATAISLYGRNILNIQDSAVVQSTGATGEKYAVYASVDSIVNIAGGTVYCANYYAVRAYCATVNITGGEVSVLNGYALYAEYSKVYISGGSVKSPGSVGANAVFAGYSAAVLLTGGEVSTSNQTGLNAINVAYSYCGIAVLWTEAAPQTCTAFTNNGLIVKSGYAGAWAKWIIDEKTERAGFAYDDGYGDDYYPAEGFAEVPGVTVTPSPIGVFNVIEGVTAPVAGAIPVMQVLETLEYTGKVTWSPADNPFKPNTTYTANITITPKKTCTLTGVAAGFFTVTGAVTTVHANADSGFVTATFPATGAADYAAEAGGKSYSTLDYALAAVQNEQTVKLLKDITLTVDNIYINNGQSFTFNTNGKTLDFDGYGIEIYGGSGVTFTGCENFENLWYVNVYWDYHDGLTRIPSKASFDSGLVLGGELYAGDGSEITVNGNVSSLNGYGADAEYDGAKITITGDINARYGVYAWDGAKVTVGGNIISFSDGVYAEGNSEVTVGGYINSSDGYGIYAGDAKVTVTGNIKSYYCVYAYNGAEVTVTGDITSDDDYGIQAFNEGTKVTVVKGGITSKYDGVYAEDGAEITVTGNIDSSDGYGINADNEGTKVTVTGDIKSYYCVYAQTGAEVTVTGDITSDDYYGINAVNEGTKVTVTGDISSLYSGVYAYNGAEVTVKGNITSSHGYGIDAELGAKVTVTGDIKSYYCVYAEDGAEVTVTGNITSDDHYGIQAYNEGTKVTVTGDVRSCEDGVYARGGAEVNITGDVTSSGYYGIEAHNNGTKVTVTGDVKSYDEGVYADDGAEVIVNGDVTSLNHYGVYAEDGAKIYITGTITSGAGYEDIYIYDSDTFGETFFYINDEPSAAGYEYLGYYWDVYTDGTHTVQSFVYLRQEPIMYTVTFTAPGGHGAITAKVDGVAISSGAKVQSGKNIVFTASPATGYNVQEWSDNVTGLISSTETTYTLKGLAGNYNITAAFVIKQYNFSFILAEGAEENGTLTKEDGDGNVILFSQVNHGTKVVLTATPDAGYRVKEWKDNGKAVNGTSLTYTIESFAANHTVTVEFELISYTVTFSAGENGSVTAKVGEAAVASGDAVLEGKNVVFTAVPASGYRVKQWKDNGAAVSGTSLTYIVSGIAAGHTVTVEFELIPAGGTTYPVTEQFGTWKGSGEASAKINGDFTKFVKLTLNGETIDASDYDVTEGSTVITLKESYLKKLSNGDYTFIAEFSDGASGSINLKVDNGKSGLPGWAVALIVIGCVLVLAAGGFCLYWFVFRKKKAA